MQSETIAPEEASHVLGTCLTEDEREELVAIRHQLSESIDWGDLVNTIKAEMLGVLDGVILDGVCSRTNPFEKLEDTEQDFLYGDHENVDIRKRFVMLLLFRKLLGGLKQNVRKNLDALVQEALDYETESQLKAIVAGEDPDEDEVELSAIIVPDEEGEVCAHLRKTVRKIPADGKKQKYDILQTQCRACGENVGQPRVCGSYDVTVSKDPADCQHTEAEWKEGEEGKTAICYDCGGVAPNPGKYQWSSVGLEPLGDNPDDDEMETIIDHA
jgi:hypothetical protein